MGQAATIFLDEPQAESLEGTTLKARGTLRVQRAGETEPVAGTAWYEADVQINRARRTVNLVSVEVSKVDLLIARPALQKRMATRIGLALTRRPVQLQLDDVLAAASLVGRREQAPPKLNTDPPRILFETEPAILISFDGEPRFRVAEGSRLERALNTPFLVLHDPVGGAYYLNGGTTWFRAPGPKGPWTGTDAAPAEAIQIARRDLHDAGVADSEVEQAKRSAAKRAPKIVVATDPTELIVSDGPPRWSPIVAGELDAMANSENDVFRTSVDRQYWLVLSGRWYKSDSYSGPWTYVEPDRLPGSFLKIPSDSAKAEVLTFVPGTGAAQEALADANKPRTAAVRRSEAHVSVTYDGEPRFDAVPGTQVEYAVNTPEQVLRIRGRFYVCDQGVWFTAAAATGPWQVADSIPEQEIQALPPDSPVYNTRFVYVYDSTPEVIYEAYTPAYLGSYPYYGTVVFGTGWVYRPWWGAYYYPRPWTWGFHAMYAPWAGWGFGFGWGPAWAGFRYGFGFGWGARWCGPGAFFRPAFRNVNITRNVNVTRNVYVTRNLYDSGANKTRATMIQSAPVKTAGVSRAAVKSTAGKSTPLTKQGPSQLGGKVGARRSSAAQGKSASIKPGKANPSKGARSKAGVGRGGGKKP